MTGALLCSGGLLLCVIAFSVWVYRSPESHVTIARGVIGALAHVSVTGSVTYLMTIPVMAVVPNSLAGLLMWLASWCAAEGIVLRFGAGLLVRVDERFERAVRRDRPAPETEASSQYVTSLLLSRLSSSALVLAGVCAAAALIAVLM